jgi:predicted dehydrogenase
VSQKTVRFGVIGAGLMSREFASAAARWCHLVDFPVRPEIVAVASRAGKSAKWFAENVPAVKRTTTDYREVLADPEVEAVYAAVPHDLHEEVYVAALECGKHLLGEKPFGIDLAANAKINAAIAAHPECFVRCVTQLAFFPGALSLLEWARAGRFGRLIEVEAGFWHSSDLDPEKPVNWKRRLATNGEYGCMGDLGLHVVFLPLRLGWKPRNVRALLSNIMPERPDGQGGRVPCETWDNAILSCEAAAPDGQVFPMTVSTKRIMPGHGNTWFLRVIGTDFSAEFSTRNPKRIRFLEYRGGEQAWSALDLPNESAYPTISGRIFEFNFSDALMQMIAAFLDELERGEGMAGPLGCATPEEAAAGHRLFTAALESGRTGATVTVD